MPIPVAVGNTTNAEAAFLLMEQGAAAVFVTRTSWAIREKPRTLRAENDLSRKDYDGLRPGMYVNTKVGRGGRIRKCFRPTILWPSTLTRATEQALSRL